MGEFRNNIKTAAVIGSGTMGRGICQVFAQEGYKVIMCDLNQDILLMAVQQIKNTLAIFVEEGVLAAERIDSIMDNISVSDSFNPVKDVDFIVEAVPEVMDIKKQVFTQLEKLASPDVVLASNTSGISITAMGSLLKNPARFVGMHWWNPAFITPVIEIIKGNDSSDEAVGITKDLAIGLKKQPVMVKKDIPGFLGNRMQYALMREALFLLENGVATIEDIDTMVKAGFGFKYPVLGPLETIDMAGMDIYYNVSGYLYQVLDDAKEPGTVVTKRMESGELGLKTGKGFYNYESIDMKGLARERTSKMISMLKGLGYIKSEEEKK